MQNAIKQILTKKNLFTGIRKVPKLKFIEAGQSLIILGMPRELSRLQIDFILDVTKGQDYRLIVQRGTDKHMMMIEVD